MAHTQEDTEQALLVWVNTFPLDVVVTTLADLTDGMAFSRMLEEFDAAYAVATPEQTTGSSKWLSKKKNLETIYRALLRYIGEECDDLDSVSFESRIDFNAIAEHDDTQQTKKVARQSLSDLRRCNSRLAYISYQLTIIFLMAAIGGSKKSIYISQILQLEKPIQKEIKRIIEEALRSTQISTTLANYRQANTDAQQIAVSHASGATNPETDQALALEEDYANLYADNEQLKKKHADFITRFERLQQNHDDLIEHSNTTDSRLAAFEDSNDDDKTEYIKKLQAQIDEQNRIIESHEADAENSRVAKDGFHRELATLRPMASKLTECQDQLQELKNENMNLSRKANTVDHFQKKLEMKMQVEKDNAMLRQRVDTLEENQKDYDKVHEDNYKIRTTLAEYSKRFEQQELNIVELSSQKNLLKQELQSKDLQISSFEERRQHDEKFMVDLQEQIRTNATGPMSPESPTAKFRALSLEEELEESDSPNHALEISRLKAENQLLKSNTAGTTNPSLRLELEEAQRVRKQLEEKYREVFDNYVIGQQQLNAIVGTSSDEKNESVLNTRKLYLEANQELTAAKAKLAQLELELTDRDRQLLDVKADVAAVDQAELKAVEDLKATHEIIHNSLQNDLVLLQGKLKALTTDFDVQKNQLVAALVSKDSLMQEISSLKDGANGDDVNPAKEAEKTALKEQIQKQETIIADLQQKIKEAVESSPDTQRAANEALIKNLKRENALISTAWYDLSSRLQSNHVVLQRRSDAPKSWLNKQRQMVNATTGRR